jgi:hypothetical protein
VAGHGQVAIQSLVAVVWLLSTPLAQGEPACVFDDAAISAQIIARLQASTELDGLKIDEPSHTAIGILGNAFVHVKWWGCNQVAMDARLIAVFPHRPISDLVYWTTRITLLARLLLNLRDQALVERAMSQPKAVTDGTLFTVVGSSYDNFDILLRNIDDFAVVRLNLARH